MAERGTRVDLGYDLPMLSERTLNGATLTLMIGNDRIKIGPNEAGRSEPRDMPLNSHCRLDGLQYDNVGTLTGTVFGFG